MRKVVLVLVAVAACAVLAGCAKPVQKYYTATGGSRADATIKLSFEYDPAREIPEPNEMQALETAKKRCNSWGYPEVEAFGGHTRQCTQFQPGPFGGPMCVTMFVTKEYQCLGRGDAPTPDDKPVDDSDEQEKKNPVKRK